MKISIVTDEISADPETAIELGVEWGVRNFELRGFGSDRVPLFSSFQRGRLREILEAFESRVVAISPGLFKCPIPLGTREHFPLRTFDYDLHRRWRNAQDLVAYHREELLPLSIEFAKDIGAKMLIAFSFKREEKGSNSPPDEILEILKESAEEASKNGLLLAIEVEAGFWADTGRNAARVVEGVNHPALGINWDPANAYVAGDTPYPKGYEAVRQYISHVHFKDIERATNGDFRFVVKGEIDWSGQIHALAQDGYQGYISVETHMAPKINAARGLTERLQQLLEASKADAVRDQASQPST